jgi:transposase-like protein
MANKNIFSHFPKSLQACIQYFSDEDVCIRLLASIRWPDGKVACMNCGNKDAPYYLENQKRWKCRSCKKQFSVKQGTIFEDSPISLTKWFPAMWLICGAKNGISSCEIGRALEVTQKTAWFMMHRIRLAMTQGSLDKMGGDGGTVEADETFIGGLSRNMHKSRRAKTITGTGGKGKVAVFGLLERHSEGKSRVRAQVVPNRWKETLHPIIKENVETGSNVYTDEHLSYRGLSDEQFAHEFVKHAEYYVRGAVHTNGIENFWTLLKRTIKGTYVSVEPFHTFRYLDEQAFRFNERFGDDGDRFLAALHEVAGKRVTYSKLTGKDDARPSVNDEGNDNIPESWN